MRCGQGGSNRSGAKKGRGRQRDLGGDRDSLIPNRSRSSRALWRKNRTCRQTARHGTVPPGGGSTLAAPCRDEIVGAVQIAGDRLGGTPFQAFLSRSRCACAIKRGIQRGRGNLRVIRAAV